VSGLPPYRTARANEALRTPLGIAAAAAVALAADVAFDPVHRHVPMCPFHAVTGWWCPLCGGLRAADSLAHLNITTALHDNVLFVAALPFVALWWLDWLIGSRIGRRPRHLAHLLPVAVALAVLFWITRNLPFAAALRPG
jgi:hypothetical protein